MSPDIKLISECKMKFDSQIIHMRIQEVVFTENDLSKDIANDIAFHLTDWLDELEKYVEFCSNPGKLTNEEIDKLLIAFLIHVPNHLAAASKLYLDIPVSDIFGIKATSESDIN
ncbi:hypothetical protein MCAMS1_02214 [biofilm metagenome]